MLYSLQYKWKQLLWLQYYFRYLLKNKFENKNRFCPITQQKYFSFLPVNHDLHTPLTGIKSRHRMIWIYLQRHTSLFRQNHRVLHIAPEFELMQGFLKYSNISYTACDNFTDNYQYHGEVKKEDLCNLSFAENSFTFIVCNHVLEHIDDDQKAIENLYRILCKGGFVIITVPILSTQTDTLENSNYNTPALRKKHFGQYNHVRQYGMDIMKRFTEAGFKATCLKSDFGLNKEERERYGILEDVFFVLEK